MNRGVKGEGNVKSWTPGDERLVKEGVERCLMKRNPGG